LPGTTPFDGFTVDQVKADPKVLDWTRIETFYPKNVTTWVKGLAGTGIIVSPMLVWNRNHQSSGDCAKSAVFKTQADQDLFWLAAFGMAYWGNVVNKYGLTHMEVSNEPDNCGGNQVNTPDTATHNRMMELA
jgi:hypothetical protein